MGNYFVQYSHLFKAFCFTDEQVKKIRQNMEVAMLELRDDDYKFMGLDVPAPDAPVVALLMGREHDSYASDWNYVRALAKTGVRIRFITYDTPIPQMFGCDGLVLPGGSFKSPEEFYVDANMEGGDVISERAMAYMNCINCAVADGMPILGICAGAQMVAGMFRMKLIRDTKQFKGAMNHKSEAIYAHDVDIIPGTMLAKLLFNLKRMKVNSRHAEMLAPREMQLPFFFSREKRSSADANSLQLPLDYYAMSGDGVPEAWGSEAKKILCIQWHPEDFCVLGDAMMQRIYGWLADKARDYKKSRE
ncbi:MAG: gamma-glutamyl-gamma-aminobutyrate hydrolase family protein [Alphaproteobacteria bacterium]|nr:gamma-glutamyl-gamma-aminobutyrate hydrolase family protein [Alphaproteobacteria bacterium]